MILHLVWWCLLCRVQFYFISFTSYPFYYFTVFFVSYCISFLSCYCGSVSDHPVLLLLIKMIWFDLTSLDAPGTSRRRSCSSPERWRGSRRPPGRWARPSADLRCNRRWVTCTGRPTTTERERQPGRSPTDLLYDEQLLVLPEDWQDASSVREYVFYVFFRFQKNMTFYVFFEMTYQKVVKSQ